MIEYEDNFDEIAKEFADFQKTSPKLFKKYYTKIGNKAKRTIIKKAKNLVKVGKKQQNRNKKYHNRFKLSKIWNGYDNTVNVKVYNTVPHAHLIEYGHVLVKNGNKIGFVDGKYPVKRGSEEYESSGFRQDLESVIDNVLKDGGF